VTNAIAAGATVVAARLFIGVWPTPATRSALQGVLGQWVWPVGAAVVALERLHLTLHFLGQVPLARVDALCAALPAAAAGIAPFDLAFDRVERWPHGLVVLGTGLPPAPLAQLHVSLTALLRGLALPIDPRPFRPHVTLARRAAGAVAPPDMPPLHWPVNHFALVHSERGYHQLQRWPLAA